MKVYLIHAVMPAIAPVQHEILRLWPDIEACNLLDDSLEADKARSKGELTERIAALAEYANANGAHGILFTCSAFGKAIEHVASQLNIPVLKPNEAMFYEAISKGGRVAMLATFEPAIEGMEKEFNDIKHNLKSAVTLETICVPEAREALNAGNVAKHDDLVAEAASQLTGIDTIMLAHFSTSTALQKVTLATDAQVLTSPGSAVASLKQRVLENAS